MSFKRRFRENLANPTRSVRSRLGQDSGPSSSQAAAQDDPADPAHAHAHDVWDKFRAALRGLEKCSNLFPPLKPAISLLAECITELPVRRMKSLPVILSLIVVVQDADKRRQDYCDLASDLAALVDSLTQHLQDSRSTAMSNCVVNIVK
jgi:hypothetical protein